MKPIVMTFMQPAGFNPITTSAYEVELSGKYKRLRLLCWWILRKLGAVRQHFDREQMYAQVRIDPKQAGLKVIMEARKQLALAGRRPNRILIGLKEFYDLMADPALIGMPGFRFTSPVQENQRIFDMEIEVVPHMEGILVLYPPVVYPTSY